MGQFMSLKDPVAGLNKVGFGDVEAELFTVGFNFGRQV